MGFMFIGGKFDRAFGPVVVFAFGGIYVEVFKDVQTCLCPADPGLVRKKIESLKSYAILKGARGIKPAVCPLLVPFFSQGAALIRALKSIGASHAPSGLCLNQA
jgi:hypothetical protein